MEILSDLTKRENNSGPQGIAWLRSVEGRIVTDTYFEQAEKLERLEIDIEDIFEEQIERMKYQESEEKVNSERKLLSVIRRKSNTEQSKNCALVLSNE